jgi:hypothetical protein
VDEINRVVKENLAPIDAAEIHAENEILSKRP